MIYKKITFFSLVISFLSLLPAAKMIINQPGCYQLSSDIVYSSSDPVINITVSNVELDLGGFVVNNSSSGYGIFINADLSNIVIKNGELRGGSGTGIYMTATAADLCYQIFLQNLRFDSWGGQAISCVGTSASQDVSALFIENVQIFDCSSTAANLLNFQYCNNIAVRNCIVSNCTSTAATFSVFNIENINAFTGEAIEVNACTGASSGTGAFNAFFLSAANKCIFRNCIVRECKVNSGLSGLFYGFSLNTSINNLFYECTILDNTAGGTGAGRAFYAQSNSHQNMYIKCHVLNNTANANWQAFTESSVNKGVYIDCVIKRNHSDTFVSGIYFLSGQEAQAINCISLNNSGPSTYGFISAAGTNNLFFNCTANQNVTNDFIYNDTTLFVRCNGGSFNPTTNVNTLSAAEAWMNAYTV